MGLFSIINEASSALKSANEAMSQLDGLMKPKTVAKEEKKQEPVKEAQKESIAPMFSEDMEKLIDLVIEDGMITDQKKLVLVKRAQKEGIDIDELEIYLQVRLKQRNKEIDNQYAKENQAGLAGTIRKCPACGGIIEPGVSVCPSCGMAINDESISSTVQELKNKLEDIDKASAVSNVASMFIDLTGVKLETAKRKFAIITSTIVPNNRGHLLELMAFVKPKSDKFGSKDGAIIKSDVFKREDLSYAYWLLYEQCINLARGSFSSDAAFKMYFDFYEEESNKLPPKGLFGKLFG